MDRRQERAALGIAIPASFPATHDPVEDSTGIPEKFLALFDGKLIEIGDQETVPAIEDHVPIIEIGAEPISHIRTGLGRQGGGIAAACGREVSGEHIATLELQTIPETFVRVCGEAVVVAPRAIGSALDNLPVLEGAPLPGPVVVPQSVGLNLVEVLHYFQIAAVVPDVREAKTCPKAEFTLQGQVPLLDTRVYVVNRKCIVEASGAGLRLIDWVREG